MRKWLCAAVALGTLLLTGLISAAPAAAQDQQPTGRDGSFSCRASALRVGPIEPLTAGDNTATVDNTTDASDPCRPGTAGLSDYTGPTGCLIEKIDPNCFHPNRVSVGLLYATTEECRPNQQNPAAPNAGPGAELCRTNGAVELQNHNPREGDGVKARAGVADLFLTAGGTPDPRATPQGNFIHISAINAFAEVTCRPRNANLPVGRNNPLVPMWDARSQVVFINLGGVLTLDLVPGLIPNGTPTVLNRYGNIGPIRFNATYINNNEPGGPRGPDEGNPTLPDPGSGLVDLTQDANPFNEGHDPIFKVTQRAVDIAGAIVAGEATVDAGDLTGRGLITITKDSQPDDDQDFTFRGSPSGAGVVLDNGVEPCSPARNRPGTGTFAEFALDDDDREGPGDRDRDGDGQEDDGDDEEDENGRNGDEDRGDDDVDEDGVGDEDDQNLPRSRSFRVRPGTYTVAETAVEGWDLDQIRCRENRTANSRGDANLGTAMINVDEGETVRCVFVNEKEREPEPPKCDRDNDGHHDEDKDRNGHDDRDRNRDGRDDRDGRDLRSGRDRNGDNKDDECERDRKQRERDAKAKKAKKACTKAVKSKASKKGAAKKACKQKKAKRTKKAAKRTKRNKR